MMMSNVVAPTSSSAAVMIKTFLTHLHQHTKRKLVLHTTGVGSQSIAWILSVAGASNTILEATIPYSMQATDLLLHPLPSAAAASNQKFNYVSSDTAVMLAKKAYERALQIQLHSLFSTRQQQQQQEDKKHSSFLQEYIHRVVDGVVGVSCTGAIATTREKKGDHKAYIGLYSHNNTARTYDIILEKGVRDREGEEQMVSSIILKAIADACLNKTNDQQDTTSVVEKQLHEWINTNLTAKERSLNDIVDLTSKISFQENSAVSTRFFSGLDHLCLYVPSLDREISQLDASALLQPQIDLKANGGKSPSIIRLVYPGSFNPLHIGHMQLIQSAYRIQSRLNPNSCIITIFELSVDNVDKPSLDEETVRHRLSQFKNLKVKSSSEDSVQGLQYQQETNFDNMLVAVTHAPLFLKKAELIPGSVFVIGMDTALRLIDPKYYNNSVEQMVNALMTFKALKCSFMVAGRQNQRDHNDKTFQTWSDIDTEKLIGFRDLFFEIPESEFRVDICSSELRQPH